MRYFYNAQLIETTQDAKVVFYQSQFSCHNAKVVLADRGDNGQVLIGQSPRHRRTFPQSRFPSLEAFGRRPRRQLHRRDGPSSETLHKLGHCSMQSACLKGAKSGPRSTKLNNGSSKGCLQFLNLRRGWPDITLLR